MKKSKLIVDHNFDFELAGIISNAKGYKLTWEINRALKLNFIKAKDLVLSFIDSNRLTILNYKYETENSKLLLLKNKGVESDELRVIQYAIRIDIEKLKSKENLLF